MGLSGKETKDMLPVEAFYMGASATHKRYFAYDTDRDFLNQRLVIGNYLRWILEGNMNLSEFFLSHHRTLLPLLRCRLPATRAENNPASACKSCSRKLGGVLALDSQRRRTHCRYRRVVEKDRHPGPFSTERICLSPLFHSHVKILQPPFMHGLL